MPIITLSTDIGQSDYISGAVKGQLLCADASWNIVDITHQLPSQNYLQAAYLCANAFKHFPSGTFHIILINFFNSLPKYLLLAEYKEQFIACPDNGILTMITANKPKNVVAISMDSTNGAGILDCTKTLASAYKKLNDTNDFFSVGKPIENIEEKYPLRSSVSSNWIDSQIIFIDNFENVVINITKEEFEEHRNGRSFKIIFLREETIDQISENYASVAPGEKLAWFNSAGYLEIAINNGNMAGLFGLQGFNENSLQNTALQNKLLYQTIRIFFE